MLQLIFNILYIQIEVCKISVHNAKLGIDIFFLLSFPGYAFRLDGQYFVLAERHRSKDSLGVYDAHDAYRLVRVCDTAVLLSIMMR